ncbi:glycosyltransferase family 2 protein [Bifidobacterium oedipodis]|uniref:Glycosyl transferase family 2 n=1 Tax=Bifidobacterium oedipodis TaxID=2675322 RepID=A0A7Y0ETJ0_9BIFI|nr:glycosyltransferase family 2 protein [Bifidobacterium sp. DSM 109957]NMM95096.1 Glycosyl transferase family 2 [Bifidobacterium sp. DSM 109957]
MTITMGGLCRGNGKGYVKLDVEGHRVENLYAVATAANGNTIMCGVYPYGFPGEDPTAVAKAGDEHAVEGDGKFSCVVAVPLLDGTDLTVNVFDHTVADTSRPVFTFPFKPLESKVRSRLFYKFHSDVAFQMRDIDQRRLSGNIHVFVPGIYPIAPDEVSCRFVVRAPYVANAQYEIHVYDHDASELDVQPIVIENGQIHANNGSTIMREICYSIRMPKTSRTLCVSVEEKGHDYPYGNFACVLPPAWEGFVNGAYEHTRNAYHDPAYPNWLEQHRATYGDLAQQRAMCQTWEHQPLISLVVVLFRTPAPYLRAMLNSLLAQSYEKFELLLVDVSDNYPEIDRVLAEYRDDRIRVIKAKNRNIADNTNVGIREAVGDYVGFVDHDDTVEPDALYQYVAEINRHPDVDLLYCDEDRLENGEYRQPFFKPGFNRDLLYSYNYVTHLLMVSRYALNRVELSTADVAGAQDYDLILKSIEVARCIRHVPHMLYHWRMHPGSTSVNPDSKPYADEAGRLALSRHFERTGVKAEVMTSELPFRYRTRYQFDHAPKVSIVIPTKDHSDILSKCVDAVLSKTEYDNYEIIMVENNSVEEATFAYYERIAAEQERVRVVRWPGHGFNYSAICNYGATFATGELILFLNNDTEVINAEWLGNMVNHFGREDVGMVGAKLICHDGIVQHGGVWVAVDNCGYLGYDLAADDSGYMETMRYPSNVPAVTGACQMIRRSVYEQIGGLDESLVVVLNDVDLSLKVGEAGYLVVFEPQAMLYHNEFTSRGRDERDPDKQRRAEVEYGRFRLRWNPTIEHGKYINSNLNQYDGNYKIAW